MSPEEIRAWKVKYDNLKTNVPMRGVSLLLSFEEYLSLAEEAGIKSEQVGARKGQYQLGRFGDVGDYKVGNVRFITKEQNLLEQKLNGGYDRAKERRSAQMETITAKRLATMSQRDYDLKGMRKKLSKNFRLISPEGVSHEGTNLNQFCKDNGLNQGALAQVCRGQSKHYKGWTGEYL